MTTKAAASPAAKHSATNPAAKAGVPEYNGNLQVADIVPDGQNRHDAADLPELAASIKAEGLLQPIVVRPCPKFPHATAVRHVVDKKEVFRVVATAKAPEAPRAALADVLLYEADDKRDADRAAAIYRSGAGWQIIAGERRWRAHRLNKAETIRAFIHRGETDVSAAVKQTIENLGRKDLDPIQEARQMKRLADMKVPQAEIGKLFGGRSQPLVANTLKLLALSPGAQEQVSSGKISAAHGQELVRFASWPKVCDLMAKCVAENNSNSGEDFINAKWLREEELPFHEELTEAKLAVEIYVGDYDYGNKRRYKVTPAMIGKPGYYKTEWSSVHYLMPADPKAPNLWEAERAVQDKAREEQAKQKVKTEERTQSTLTPAERAKRSKTIADNKQSRAESQLAHVAVLQHIKGLDELDGACLAVIAETAFAAHWKYGSSERIKGVAQSMGISMPSGSGLEIPRLSRMKPLDLLRLTAACICDRESEDCISGAYPIAEQIEIVLGAKATAALKEKARKALADEAAAKAAKKAGKLPPPPKKTAKKGGKAK